MSEKMYGPSTLNCPTHGEQRVRSVSFDYATSRCGGYVSRDGHWFHSVTTEQKNQAADRLAAIWEEHAVEDPDFMGCCEECDAYWDSTTLKFAPQEVRDEAALLDSTIAAYWHFINR